MPDYQLLINEAMLGVVKKVLENTRDHGLVADQSFYISFCTDFPGIVLSNRVRQRHPKEITIILQHQFNNLLVFTDKFSVNVSFDGILEVIHVPFSSLISFVDPLANFSLRLNQVNRQANDSINISKEAQKTIEAKDIATQNSSKNHTDNGEAKNIISLDQFRKKKIIE